ncbi:hypothetical protein DBA29_26125 [Xenophilus aerolatus]|nr:hypothetical protein [Xenophilus aerolatus]
MFPLIGALAASVIPQAVGQITGQLVGGQSSPVGGAGGLLSSLLAAPQQLSALAALGTTLAQTRFNVASKALNEGMKKLNPGQNLRQIISGKKLLMLALSLLKVGVVIAVCFVHIRGALPDILRLHRLDLPQGWAFSVDSLHGLIRAALIAMTALAGLDFVLQRVLVWRSLRMDHEEAKRDYKETEGDPHAKGHRKELKKSLLRESKPAAARPPNAVVVNPQHIAIALSYDFLEDGLPRIVQKAAGSAAAELRHCAMCAGIPVIRYVALARVLYAVGQVGAFVPSSTVKATALVYAALRELMEMPRALDEEFEIQAELADAMLPLDTSVGLH